MWAWQILRMSPRNQHIDGGEHFSPEWITVAQACRFASVSKPVLYSWLNRGLVKNFSMRERGQVRGVRRVSFDSLRAFMDSRSTGGESEPSTNP